VASKGSEANEAAFTLALNNEMSEAANDAAAALENLRDKMAKDTAEIAQLNKVLRNLKAAGKGAADEVKAIKDQLNAKRVALAAAQAATVKLGGALEDTAKKGVTFNEVLTHAKGMAGPIGTLARMFDTVRKNVSTTTIAMVAGVAALGLLAAATTRAISNLTQYAIAQQNARRAELLRLEGLAKLRTYLTMGMGIGEANGKQVQRDVDRISASYATGRGTLVRYAEQLMAMGLRGKNLSAALEGMAIKESTQGEAAAQMFAGWAQGMALSGAGVERYTARVKQRLGGLAKAAMLDANVQAQKLAESMSMLTNSVDIEPLLRARKAFNDLFSQSTASGRQLQELLGRLVQPLVNATTLAFRVMKAFFQDLIILELQLEIAYYDLRNAIVRAFRKGDVQGFFDAITSGKGILLTVFGVLFATVVLPAIWSATAALWGMAVAAFAALSPFIVAGLTAIAIAAGIALVIWSIVKIAQLVYTVFKETPWSDLGKWIIDGIVGGLKAAWNFLGDAAHALAMDLKDAFKKALGIASPSKVFAALGVDVSLGVAQGVKQGAPQARAAAAAIVPPPPSIVPSVGPSRASQDAGKIGAQGGAARGRGGGSITIQQLIVHASGAGDKAHDLAVDIKAELERLLEGVAIEMGAAT
jgi:hypothetical protein